MAAHTKGVRLDDAAIIENIANRINNLDLLNIGRYRQEDAYKASYCAPRRIFL